MALWKVSPSITRSTPISIQSLQQTMVEQLEMSRVGSGLAIAMVKGNGVPVAFGAAQANKNTMMAGREVISLMRLANNIGSHQRLARAIRPKRAAHLDL